MPVLRYSLIRVLLLLASLAALYLVGARGWLWVGLSIVIAGAVSYLAFPRQRNAAAGALQQQAEQRKARAKERGDLADEDVEDAAVEAASGAEDSAGAEDSQAPQAAGTGDPDTPPER